MTAVTVSATPFDLPDNDSLSTVAPTSLAAVSALSSHGSA